MDFTRIAATRVVSIVCAVRCTAPCPVDVARPADDFELDDDDDEPAILAHFRSRPAPTPSAPPDAEPGIAWLHKSVRVEWSSV